MLCIHRRRLLHTFLTRHGSTSVGQTYSQWLQQHQTEGTLLPPAAPALTERQSQLLGPKSQRGIVLWNSRRITQKVVFYHSTESRESSISRDLCLRVFHNAAEHPAPLRFLLELLTVPPSPEIYRELLYLSGGATYNSFVHPRAQPLHIPSATAMHELAIDEPYRLQWPLVLVHTFGAATAFRIGHKAFVNLIEVIGHHRKLQVGGATMTQLWRMSKLDPELKDPPRTVTKKIKQSAVESLRKQASRPNNAFSRDQ